LIPFSAQESAFLSPSTHYRKNLQAINAIYV